MGPSRGPGVLGSCEERSEEQRTVDFYICIYICIDVIYIVDSMRKRLDPSASSHKAPLSLGINHSEALS